MNVKTKEFKNNDIYFLEIILDKIIINDNYNGILIFDDQLNMIKKLKIFEDIMIYSTFKYNKEILLFCPDNTCLIYFHMETYEYKVIWMKREFEDVIFSPIYQWDKENIVLTTYNGEFINVNLFDKTIQKISYNNVKNLYPEFFKNFIELKNYKIIKILSAKHITIVSEKDGNITIVNYKDKMKYTLEIEEKNFIDIEIEDDIIAIIYENKVRIITKNEKKICYPIKNYIFLRGKFLKELGNIYIIFLSACQSDTSCAKIDIYDVKSHIVLC